MAERRVPITITRHQDGAPWRYAQTNLLQRYLDPSKPTDGTPSEVAQEDGETALLAYRLEREVREAFAPEVQARGHAAAVAIVRDLAAERAKLEGVQLDVEERTIYNPGDMCTGLFVIASGRVKLGLPAPKPRVVALLGPGEWFGETALLLGERHAVGAQTAERTVWHVSRPRQ